MMQLISDKQALEMKRKTMIDYLKLKMLEEDWHGIMDVAADLREIDVLLNYLNEKEKWKSAQEVTTAGLPGMPSGTYITR